MELQKEQKGEFVMSVSSLLAQLDYLLCIFFEGILGSLRLSTTSAYQCGCGWVGGGQVPVVQLVKSGLITQRTLIRIRGNCQKVFLSPPAHPSVKQVPGLVLGSKAYWLCLNSH